MILLGEVHWFNPYKGYGFIRTKKAWISLSISQPLRALAFARSTMGKRFSTKLYETNRDWWRRM